MLIVLSAVRMILIFLIFKLRCTVFNQWLNNIISNFFFLANKTRCIIVSLILSWYLRSLTIIPLIKHVLNKVILLFLLVYFHIVSNTFAYWNFDHMFIYFNPDIQFSSSNAITFVYAIWFQFLYIFYSLF